MVGRDAGAVSDEPPVDASISTPQDPDQPIENLTKVIRAFHCRVEPPYQVVVLVYNLSILAVEVKAATETEPHGGNIRNADHPNTDSARYLVQLVAVTPSGIDGCVERLGAVGELRMHRGKRSRRGVARNTHRSKRRIRSRELRCQFSIRSRELFVHCARAGKLGLGR
jgi:hypothetical protein